MAISADIAHPAATQFNQPVNNESDVPLEWRFANITLIFKKGSRNSQRTIDQLALPVNSCKSWNQ